MILPDDTPSSPTKSRAALSPSLEDARGDVPPAYPGHRNLDLEAQAGNSLTPLIQQPLYAPSHPVEQVEPVEPAGPRFFKAFGVALFIYFLLASYTASTSVGVHWDGDGIGHVNLPYPQQSEGKLISCSSADSVRTHARTGPVTSFVLPLSADVLRVYARGALSHGSIMFVPTTDRSIPEGNIRVDITPHYKSGSALRFANICLLEPTPSQRSVAILTPKQWVSISDLEFKVEVLFPAQYTPLQVKAFETHLPMFEHAFSELDGRVSFGTLNILSTNMPIHAWSVSAENATIVTTNARIDGKFRVSRSLVLETSNHAIDTQVTLDHEGTPPDLTMATTNGRIDSRVSLQQAARVHPGAPFSVSATTSNGGIDLAVTAQPIDSALTLLAYASNSPAIVHLHPAFEGVVEVGTSHSTVDVEVDMKAADPAGAGRPRSWVVGERTMRTLKGVVSWGSPHGRPLHGKASVVSSNGLAVVKA